MSVRIDNWSVCVPGADPYTPPELIRQCLQGNVFGDARREDGHLVCTSPIVGKKGERVATRSGSCYELGSIDPAYEAVHPNARQRLLDSLPEVH